MIDKDTIDKIMEATNIVDVVSEFVTLRKAGINYKGLCPFHDDKTPSFMVSPTKGICHCFACGKGGNAVNFLMEHEQISYPDALRWLAKKYNIEIQERELSAEEKQQATDRAYRIGQKQDVTVYHLISQHTIEEKILRLHKSKRDLADSLLEGTDMGHALTQAELLELLA